MHPALYSWREELPATVVRLLAYVSGIAVLSMGAAQFFASAPVMRPIAPAHSAAWSDVERPFPAFALWIPEAAEAPSGYAIRRHNTGGGRKDILMLGNADGTTPFLLVEIYRPGSEIRRFADAQTVITEAATALKPIRVWHSDEPVPSKFGPLTIVAFDTSQGTPRRCLGFVRAYNDPLLQLSGWFCQGGDFIERPMLACALDRLSLLSAGSEPKVGALFAQAELNRTFCGHRNPILASTPKYKALWKGLEKQAEPRRTGR